ncbi:energy transducer TonB [Methyloligella sp. GL2]|nr:energy transducer TonB [Methyloligella sp. GL2]
MIDMSAETVAPSAQEESIAERTDRVERDLEKPVEQQQELTEEPVETVETIDPEETLSAEPAEIAAEEMLPDAAAVEMQELDQDVEVPLPLRRPHREEPPPEEKPLQKKAASPPKKTAPSSASKAAVRAQKSAPRLSAQQSSKGNAPSISPARWRSRLMAHLERHKRYPSSSRARREQGVAYVRFRIDSRGNVLSVSLARSSGFSALDREVVAMVRRASPVPAPPPGVQRTITAPVRFNVR